MEKSKYIHFPIYGYRYGHYEHYGRQMDRLREKAARLGLTKEDARKYGKLNLIHTWEKLIEAHTPQPGSKKREIVRIHCLDCFGRNPHCQRCEGHGLIWNRINIRQGYFGKWQWE